MISAIERDIDGRTEVLKFSTRAQARVERELGASMAVVLTRMNDQYGVHALAQILAAAWNGGRGVDVDRVYDKIDVIGQARAGALVTDLINAAFPSDDNGEEAKDAAKKS